MAIQFTCPSCSQPIEVDEDLGGKNATCPYCRNVVSVPVRSTLDAARVPPLARPAAGGDEVPRGVGGAGVIDENVIRPAAAADNFERRRLARKYGFAALFCAALTVLLWVVLFVLMMRVMVPKMGLHPGSQPSPQEIQELQAATMEELGKNPAFVALNLGSGLVAVIGLCLAIVSITRSARGNWAAIVSLVLCGACVLCFCLGTVMAPFLARAAP